LRLLPFLSQRRRPASRDDKSIVISNAGPADLASGIWQVTITPSLTWTVFIFGHSDQYNSLDRA
jgi:hypothetical protein